MTRPVVLVGAAAIVAVLLLVGIPLVGADEPAADLAEEAEDAAGLDSADAGDDPAGTEPVVNTATMPEEGQTELAQADEPVDAGTPDTAADGPVLVAVSDPAHVEQLVRTAGDLARLGSGLVRVVTVAVKPHDSPFGVFDDETIRQIDDILRARAGRAGQGDVRGGHRRRAAGPHGAPRRRGG